MHDYAVSRRTPHSQFSNLNWEGMIRSRDLTYCPLSSRKRRMASLSSWRERNTVRLRRFLVSFAKKLSTALSQEADVGVKWKTNREWFSIHSRTLGCL